MGLCIKCRMKEAVNKDKKCLDCSRRYYREFYKNRKLNNLCIKCHKNNDDSSLLCDDCSTKAKIQQNDRRCKAKQNFCCVICGKQTDGQHTECDICRNKRNEEYIKKSEQRSFDGVCGQCGKCRPKDGLRTCEQCLENSRQHYQKIKVERREENHHVKMIVFNHYGHRCKCCGESHELLLNIDHVNNDGKQHRKIKQNSHVIYKDIIDRGFPNCFQLLCWNCNMGKHLNNGICPHQN